MSTLAGSTYEPLTNTSSTSDPVENGSRARGADGGYRVYRRRWFGLVQIVLLNIVVSWDWLSFSAVSRTAAEFFSVSETAVNWLSTSFLFAFVVASPVVLPTLHRGPKPALITASILIFLGNWIRYAGTRSSVRHRFAVVMTGQILIGFAQPFVLAAPTRYSDLWFTATGRISATAVGSLANPLGGALGQLISPFWASSPGQIPSMVLYIALISSLASLPSFFVPSSPPTPPCPSAASPKTPLRQTWRILASSVEFWFLFIPFSVYVGFFNAFSSLINQILSPSGFTETQSGLSGGILILVGLLFSAIIAPLTSRYTPSHPSLHLHLIKTLTPFIPLAYLLFLFIPATRSEAGLYVLSGILGAASFALVPLVLEFGVDVLHPVGPEVLSTILWGGGQLLGAIFLLVMGALKTERRENGDDGSVRGDMTRALVFEAVIAAAAVPLVWSLGAWGRGAKVRSRRSGGGEG
ncbi:MAG: hypothetical protein M1817_003064 [Caeruleum heppii]|nr:MAG: hypothetical protein M1817_003064 [Caeruleum heppii]